LQQQKAKEQREK
jgi:hypothetical protein